MQTIAIQVMSHDVTRIIDAVCFREDRTRFVNGRKQALAEQESVQCVVFIKVGSDDISSVVDVACKGID